MKNLHDFNESIHFHTQHTFTLTDRIKHPLFWWPKTMLTYKMNFSGAQIPGEEALSLENGETGEALPFQLSQVQRCPEGFLTSATLHFLADLPSGETRSFILKKEPGKHFKKAVTVKKEPQSLWLSNGILGVEIPASQTYPQAAPGPYTRVLYHGISYGSSSLDCGKKQLVELESFCTETGSIFTDYTLRYHFSLGGKYEATIRLIRDMDFFEFEEQMEGLTESDAVQFRFNWNGLNPTHRHAPNNPSVLHHHGEDRYENYNWQRIEPEYVELTSHPLPMWSNKNHEIPFRLALFEPQAAMARVASATFWNQETSVSAGTFLTDHSLWDNKRYDIFSAWNGFAISFFYENGLLWWKYPIMTGCRKTAVTMYDHEKDRAYFQSVLPKENLDQKFLSGGTGVSKHAASYVTFLQNRYSLLHLNRVKDFVLEYPKEGKRLPKIRERCAFATYQEFEEYLFQYILIQKLPTHGQCENAGFHSVTYRRLSGIFFDAYNCLWETIPDENRKRIEAILLLLTYYAAAEDASPIIHMLGGPPNLNHDIKKALPCWAAMFPEHPHALLWGKIYAKSVALNLRFSVRPCLRGAKLTGGRWTENIGTYTWAFLSAAIYGCKMLEEHNGFSNLLSNPHTKSLAHWLVYSLTAPFEGEKPETAENFSKDGHYWGCFRLGEGPHRVHLPIGAHSARRTVPKSMEYLADHLERYDPILAENIRYICPHFADDFEAGKWSGNRPRSEEDRLSDGTRPSFCTEAFTGFGVMLRSGVNTEKEMSVFLQQIDEGPNYRWGTASGWGSGSIYYYANQKAYSHNGMEDAGDRRLNDCDVGCNFGVWRGNGFRSIGPNVLENGYHDLGTFQYAVLSSDQGAYSYAYPEYLERSVLLSGSDYISIYDVTGGERCATRFSWSVHSNDEFPEIHLLTYVENRAELTTHNHKESITTRWYDGRGCSYAIVTHRKDLTVEAIAGGAVISDGSFRDILFRQERTISTEFEGVTFEGKVGALRIQGEEQELSLLRGSKIATSRIQIETDSEDVGVSLKTVGENFFGKVSSLKGGRIRISHAASGKTLFVDALPVQPEEDGWCTILPGDHLLEVSGKEPVPMAAEIKNVAVGDGCCEIFLAPVSGAAQYRILLSSDLCRSWQEAAVTENTQIKISGLSNGKKYFLRVEAVNQSGISGAASPEYPLYPTKNLPLFPEGLQILLRPQATLLHWGKVLGCHQYSLYGKDESGTISLLYSGEEQEVLLPPSDRAYQYAVSATNLNGEGEYGRFETDNNPDTLENYDPMPNLEFSRSSQYCHHPFIAALPHKYKYVMAEYPDLMK